MNVYLENPRVLASIPLFYLSHFPILLWQMTDRHYTPLHSKIFCLNKFKSRIYLTFLIPLDLHISSGSFKGSMNLKRCWLSVRTLRNIISENVRIYSSLTSCNNWKNIPLWSQVEISRWLHQCQALYNADQERIQRFQKIISQEVGLLELKFVYWETTSNYVQHS